MVSHRVPTRNYWLIYSEMSGDSKVYRIYMCIMMCMSIILCSFAVLGYVVSDQGALGKWQRDCDKEWETEFYQICHVENIMTQHHYTDTEVKTAAAAANAGTCLEDGNSQNNIFSNVGDAVKAVSWVILII